MRYIFVTLCLSLFNFGPTTASGKKEHIIIKTSIACDHCLQCHSCGQNINDKIRSAENGIKKVKINARENTIEVSYLPEKTNPQQIREAISAAGFDADDVKASTNGYAKLDDCCRSK